jgi:hypothetical protein
VLCLRKQPQCLGGVVTYFLVEAALRFSLVGCYVSKMAESVGQAWDEKKRVAATLPALSSSYLRLPHHFFIAMLTKLLLLASTTLGPALCLAQATPRFYIGASAHLLSSSPFRSYNTNTFGPALTVGYQLSPRWAIQSGASLVWRNSTYSTDYSNGSGGYDRVTFELRSNLLIVPLLARYTFTDPSNPLRLDALFGASWQHVTGRTTFTYAYAAGDVDREMYRVGDNSISASAGPALRYSLGTNLELMASSVVQADLSNDYNIAGRNFSDRLSLNTQLGVQYSFGR